MIFKKPNFKKLGKRFLALSLTFVIVLTGTGFIYLFNPFNKTAEAVWFDDNWSYRQRIPIDTHTAAETNVYNEISVDTAALTTDKLQADCDDLRFTKENGEILPYQIVSGCDTSTTAIRVGFDTMPVAPFNIYMYYGNPSASSGSSTLTHSACGNGCAEGTFATEEKGQSPTLYWKFDDATGTTAQDSSQNNLDGTLNNTPTWQTEDFCISSKCLWFDGTNNENVSKTDDSKLDFVAADSFTIQAWVKRNGVSSANNFILTKAQSGYTGYKLYQDASGDYCFDVSDGTNTDTACTSGVDFDDDKWHLVQGVKNGTTSITLYVDGNQRAQDASIAATGTLANTGTFYVGVDLDETSNEWLGFIDEVKVYPYARSAAQIQADFNARSNNEGAGVRVGTALNNNPAALSNGLVGYWKMDEASWTNDCSTESVLDSSGNSNNGESCPITTGPTGGTTGKYGNAGSFDGTEDYINIDDAATLRPGSESWTVSVWANPANANQTSPLITKRLVSGTFEGFSLFICANTTCSTSGQLFTGLLIENSGQRRLAATTEDVADGNWHMYTMVADKNADRIRLYVDGVEKTTTTTNSAGGWPTVDNTDPLRFANNNSTLYYSGKLDAARIYNRALNPAEVEGLYNFAPGPIAYWKMDEGSWTNDCSTSTVFDSSGNSYNLPSCPSSTGSTGGAVGKYGNAGIFDGGTDYLESTVSTTADLTNENLTITAWLYAPPAVTSDVVLAKKATSVSTDAGYYMFINSSGQFKLHISDGTDQFELARTAAFPTNQWVHVAGVIDRQSTTISDIFINGVKITASQVGTLSNVGSLTNVRNLAIAGQDVGNTLYEGKMDDVKIYNYARTPKQIVEDMNAGHPAPGSPVGSAVGYWKIDEGYGTTANDSNPNDNDLTMSTASWTNAGKFNKAWNGDGTIWMSKTTDADLEFSAIDDFAISLWYKTDSATNPANGVEYLVSDTTGNTDVGFNIYANTDGTICFGIDDDTTSSPPMDVSSCTSTDFYDNSWHHLVAVRDVTTDKIYLYIDAVLKDSDTDPTTGTLDGNNTFYIGDFDGDNNATAGIEEFAGDIDEIKVYRFVLNSTEVKTEFNRGQAQQLGALSTSASGREVNSAASEYCIPGDASTCTAPVGEWKFEEKTGTTAFDTSTNGNDVTLTNTPTYTTGKFGAGINFAGSDQHLTRADDADFDFAAGGSFVLEAWIKHNTASAQQIILSKYNEAGYKLLMESDGDLTCGIDYDSTWTPTDSTTSTAATYDDNIWHHITCVKNANTSLTLYIDGVSVGTPDTTLTNSTLENTDPLYVGIDADGTSNDWVGQIDHVRIFNYARSQAQVAWDYNRGLPLAWWKIDECQGTTINDSSGNSFSGTWSGSGGGNTVAGMCSTAGTAWGDGVTGKRNYSLEFDGTDDIITVAANAAINFNEDSPFTISAWIRRSATGAAHRIVNKQVNTTNQFVFSLDVSSSDKLTMRVGKQNVSGQSETGDTTIAANTWYYVTGVYDGTNMTVYVNGKLDGGAATARTFSAATQSTASLYIGQLYNGTEFFNGQIDDTRIYNYALTSEQAKILYSDGAARYGPVTGAP